MNLLSYVIVLFLSEDLFPLANRRKRLGNIELVYHDVWVDPKHIFMALREDVQAVS